MDETNEPLTEASLEKTLHALDLHQARRILPGTGMVLIKRMTARERSPGGIYFANPEKPLEGRIVRMGRPRRHPTSGIDLPHLVKVMDRVIFANIIRTSFEVGGVEFCIVEQQDLHAIIEETPPTPASPTPSAPAA